MAYDGAPTCGQSWQIRNAHGMLYDVSWMVSSRGLFVARHAALPLAAPAILCVTFVTRYCQAQARVIHWLTTCTVSFPNAENAERQARSERENAL